MDVIQDFLSGFNKKGTIRIYKRRLINYFDAIGTNPNDYFDNGRDYDQDMIKFIGSIQAMKPLTKKAQINTVRAFLEENEVKLSKKTRNRMKALTRRSKPATQDIVSTPEELHDILQHGETKARAFFLFLSSTGMRIDEGLRITEDDIPAIKHYRNNEPVELPVKIYIPLEITKTDTARVTFMSNEAWETMKSWLKERDAYFAQALRKSHINEKNPDDDTIFCFGYATAANIWYRLLKKSGYTETDKSTGRYRRHIHTLRKFFRIYLAPKATSDVTELLLGHEDTLGNVYRDKYPESALAESYLKAMPDISVFEKTPDLSNINEQLKKKDKEIEEMKKEILGLRLTLVELKQEWEKQG